MGANSGRAVLIPPSVAWAILGPFTEVTVLLLVIHSECPASRTAALGFGRHAAAVSTNREGPVLTNSLTEG